MRGKNALALRKFHSLELFFGTRAVPVPLYRIACATGRRVRFLSARFHEFIVLSVRSFIYPRIVVLLSFYIIYARRSRFSRNGLAEMRVTVRARIVHTVALPREGGTFPSGAEMDFYSRIEHQDRESTDCDRWPRESNRFPAASDFRYRARRKERHA